MDANSTESNVKPLWETLLISIPLIVIMVITITGNILVIWSIFTYKPLKNVQNMFMVSLAIADITVAVMVMPFNVVYSLINKWIFGLFLCKMWLTCDVLCCTASILNLCAIALDRFQAIHDPINYAQKRTLKRVLLMIFLVWLISALISIPPLLGWNDWPDHFTEETPCVLTSEKGYLIYSSSGSFFIPLIIMTTVYVKIFLATRKRLRKRAKAAGKLNLETKIQADNKATTSSVANKKGDEEEDDEDEEEEKTIETSLNTKKTKGTKKKPDTDTNGKTCGPYNSVKAYWEQKQKISLSRERKAARVLGIVMGVFVACWLPFFLMYVIVPYCASCRVAQPFEIIITWLGYLNSMLNPIIYTIFNMDFRRAFQRKLSCCLRF